MIGTLINTYAQSQTEQNLAAALAVWLTVFLAILLIPYLGSSARRHARGRAMSATHSAHRGAGPRARRSRPLERLRRASWPSRCSSRS